MKKVHTNGEGRQELFNFFVLSPQFNQIKFKFIILSLILPLLSSCASTHPGIRATESKKGHPIIVSVNDNMNLSDKYYLFLEYTFENRSSKWRDLQVNQIGFPDFKNEILVNDHLTSWIEGAELKLKQSQYNTALLLGSITAVGFLAMSSNSNTTQAMGATAVLGATGAMVGMDISDTHDSVTSGKKGPHGTVYIPKTHVLTPFKIAPKSFVRRWIVLKNPGTHFNINNRSKCIKYRNKIDKLRHFTIQIQDGQESTKLTFNLAPLYIRQSFRKLCREEI